MLQLAHPLPADYILQISTSGIFGDSFMAFTGGTDPKAGALPMDGSAVVKASPGFLDEASQQARLIMASLTDLLSQDLRLDTKRLMHNAADLAGETAGIAKDLHAQTKQLSDVLTGIQELSGPEDKVVLFSIWDPGEQNDPNSVPADRLLWVIV